MGYYFIRLFEQESLVNIIHGPMRPTWNNQRNSQEAISKRLGCFFLAEELIIAIGNYRTWVESVPNADHFPILLQLQPTRETSFILSSIIIHGHVRQHLRIW